jgi:uncharacterized glyoxalase superfamily protein PhnB
MPSIAAVMRYRDVAAASDWLCAAFGFQKQLAATGDTGVVHYAQLTFGDAILMLAQVRETALENYMKQPDEIGGAETQSCYVLVDDADAHYARARASGAEIIVDIQDDDFGGRSYACRDPESHIWNFGTYDPWQGKRAGGRQSAGRASRLLKLAAGIALLVMIAASGGIAGFIYGMPRSEQRPAEIVVKEPDTRATQAAQDRLNAESSARQAAERATLEAKAQLDLERTARETAERAAAQLDRERAAREAAERSASEARDQLRSERSAKNAAVRAAAQLRRQLSQVQGTSQVAGEATVDVDSATGEPKSGAAKAKQKQKAKGQSE